MSFDPGRNYFDLFGFPVGFDIDAGALAARYRDLARQLHPDRFATASDQERRLSMQMTALVNEAFQTLKDPVRRARYLLSLAGVSADEQTDTAMDPAFLMEQMELREALAEVRDLDEPHTRLAELASQAERRFAEKVDGFRSAYVSGETDQARQSLREMQFLSKLRTEIDAAEEALT